MLAASNQAQPQFAFYTYSTNKKVHNLRHVSGVTSEGLNFQGARRSRGAVVCGEVARESGLWTLKGPFSIFGQP